MKEPTAANLTKPLEPSAWVEKYGDSLYRYALSRLRDGEAAEEVVQQTFLSALQHQDQFSGQGSERGWLLAILKRKLVDFIRQRNRTSPLSDDDMLETCFESNGSWKRELRSVLSRPLDALEREDFWRILRECLKELSTRQADAFVLREMDERTAEEICKELEITTSNLWVLLHRARLRLSVCMQTCWH